MRLARRIGLFLLALALLLPLLYAAWGSVQPAYSSAVARAAGLVLALEERGERVSRLETDGAYIHLRSGLREDGRPAESFRADVLHFYLVPSLAVVLAFPGLGWRRRLAFAAGTALLLFTFHVAALLAAVEQTYAGVMAEVAARNYTPREAAVYRWLSETAVYFAIQAVPAAVLVCLAALTSLGGLSRPAPAAASGLPGDGAEEARAEPSRAGNRGQGSEGSSRRRLAAGLAAALLGSLLLYAGARHMEKVRWRQSEQICARAYDLLEAGRPAEARPLFVRSVALKPGFAYAHAGLGHADLMDRRPGPAAEAFREAIRLDGGQPTWHLALSGALMSSGHPEEAVATAGAAVARWPGDPRLRVRLARLLAATGDLCAARPHFEAYLAMDPEGQEARAARRALEAAAEPCGGERGATPARP